MESHPRSWLQFWVESGVQCRLIRRTAEIEATRRAGREYPQLPCIAGPTASKIPYKPILCSTIQNHIEQAIAG